jgi:hypothetical protein
MPRRGYKAAARGIAITIQSATARAITYRVAIEREVTPETDMCPPEGCETKIAEAPGK